MRTEPAIREQVGDLARGQLGGRHLVDTDCAAIATLTSNGVFEKLVALKLDRNRIADGGVAAISKASQEKFARLELLDQATIWSLQRASKRSRLPAQMDPLPGCARYLVRKPHW